MRKLPFDLLEVRRLCDIQLQHFLDLLLLDVELQDLLVPVARVFVIRVTLTLFLLLLLLLLLLLQLLITVL